MLTALKRKPARFLVRLMAMVLVMMTITGCIAKIPSIGGDEGGGGINNLFSSNSSKEDDSLPSVFYSEFLDAKNEVVTALSDGLASNPDTVWDAMSLVGITMLDMSMLPATCFGLGQESTNIALAFMGLKDVDYTENGNSYTIKYKDNDGAVHEMSGEYDKSKGFLKCVAKTDGKEILTSEYHKTSYGYVSQFYAINDDGTTFVYKMAFNGKDGVIGISKTMPKPSSLNGSEDIDFPKECEEWYEIKNNVISGINSDGEAISFTYTPSE